MNHDKHSKSDNIQMMHYSDDALSSEFQGRSEVGMTKILQPEVTAKDGVGQASPKNCTMIWNQSGCNLKSPNVKKCRGHVSSDVEDCVSISKEREDSHESVESSNSRKQISTGKRVSSPDPKISAVSKKFKRQRNGNSCSGSSSRHGSSFANWISAITNGYKRSEHDTPLAFIPPPSPNAERNHSYLPKSNDENEFEVSCKNMGFKSIFQSLYCPSFKVQNTTSRNVDLQRDANASKEHEIVEEQLLHGSCHIACDNVELNIYNVIPKTSDRINSGSKEHVSSGSLQLNCGGNSENLHNQISASSEKHNFGTWHVQKFPLTTNNISSPHSRFHEKLKCNVEQTYILNDMGSPSFCANIVPGPTSEIKGFGGPYAVPNSSSNMAANKNSFLENLRIRQLYPKVSLATENTSKCSQDMELASERVTNNCSMLDPKGVSSNSVQRNSGHCHLLEGQMVSVKEEVQEQLIFPIDPCGSKSMSDRKVKSKFNTILPSQRFKQSEKMASAFTKRLDTFRHVRQSIASDNDICSTTICFFCGKSGHRVRECSELDETELENLLQNMNSYDDTVRSCCLCIRCFQLDHWAIACPHASSIRKLSNDNAFIVSYDNCNRVKSKPENPCSSNYGGRIILQSGDKQERHQVIGECKTPRCGTTRVENMVRVNSYDGSNVGKVVSLLNPVKEAIRKSTHKVKITSSSSGENESMENQIIPYCNVATEVTDESVVIFETIKQLRLSRTFILRWMKSPDLYFSLEGFFLRLRLGKWDEGFGGTGYHVASINGVCENQISICIGEFTYLVDYRSVSNHDFVEDELKAWWSATLKGGGKTPTVDELSKKLQERVKFGF